MNKTDKSRVATYPLRLPLSIKRAAEALAASDGASLNQFVAAAVAEKVGVMQAGVYFSERRARADWDAFDRLMARPGGEAPRSGDEMPDT